MRTREIGRGALSIIDLKDRKEYLVTVTDSPLHCDVSYETRFT